MRAFGARSAAPPPARRVVADDYDGDSYGPNVFEVGVHTGASLKRVAASTLEGLAINYLDTYGILPGFDSSGYRRFMSIPGAWRASLMLTDLFGGTPWHTYRTDPSTGTSVRTPQNASILDAPAGGTEDRVVSMVGWALDYIWNGNSVGVYTSRDKDGRPTTILPVPANAAYVRTVTDGDGTFLQPGTRQWLIGNRTFTPEEIFHIQGVSAPGELRGMGVMEMALAPGSALRLARELDMQASSIATAGVPTGTLETSNPEATKKELAAAKRGWIESQRVRTVAALGPNITFKPVAWDPEEMQLVEARKFSLSQLELVFGLPVGWLGGATSSRTYSNIEQDAVNLLKFSPLAGLFARFESKFTSLIPRGQSAKANRDAILRSDTLTRYQAHTIATGGRAWLTPDEVRGTEDVAPMGGDAALLDKPVPIKPAPAPSAADDSTDTTGNEES